MKASALHAYKRTVVWNLEFPSLHTSYVSELVYFVNNELIGSIQVLDSRGAESGTNPTAQTVVFATYVPIRFFDKLLEIRIGQREGSHSVGSTKCWCGKSEMQLKPNDLSRKHSSTITSCESGNRAQSITSSVDSSNQSSSSIAVSSDKVAFFTICSKNYLAHAKALWRSLQPHYPERSFYVVLCDRVDGYFDPDSEPFKFIYLEDLELPDLDGMARRYNITEFNTSIKPFSFKLLFRKYGYSSVIYLDPDIIAVSRLHEVDELLQAGVPGILTPHLLKPAEHDEVHDGKMLVFGIYNLGFLALSNTPEVGAFIEWWGRRLENQCLIDMENGIFVDQKWADLLPSFVAGIHILHHPGYNVAYWNLPQRSVRYVDGRWRCNELPLRFVHFSGNSIDQPEVFSRHSQQVTIQTIGDLRILLEQYRDMVFFEGHQNYRKMPYAYNWSGERGVNLHTPASLDISEAKTPRNQSSSFTSQEAAVRSGSLRLLYMDWGVPRPDIDAGSVTASIFLKVLLQAGVDVTFLPGSLHGEEPYASQMKSIGVHIITAEQTSSVYDWFAENSKYFDVFFLSRGPVCGPYIDLIKESAPTAKVIFNTVDLHYLRETREAVLMQNWDNAEGIRVTKQMELDLISKSDATIVLSTEEVYEVRRELPQAKLSTIPIVFDDVPGSTTSFHSRRDIVFIGSFPHKPNIDAVIYFSNEVFPGIQEHLPDVKFYIVGANPPEEILALEANAGIKVLGFVSVLSDIFNRVRLSVAPLRYGAGIKGKIGTSFCYGVPCIATPIAAEGMNISDGVEVLIGRNANELIDAVVKGYTNETLWNHLSRNGLQFVEDNYSVSAVGGTLTQLVMSLDLGWQQFEGLYQLASWDEWSKHTERSAKDIYLEREEYEQSLLPADSENGFHTKGYCCVCQKHTQFLTSNMYSTGSTPDGRVMPNWREHLQCECCSLVSRVRAAIHCLHAYALPDKHSRIYITEHFTKTYDWLKSRYPSLIGSEYFGSNYANGEMVGGIRNENIQDLSFADKSFDRVISLDVLEHVPDHMKAFREIFRVLDDNGILLFSVPFTRTSKVNIVRAIAESDGSIRHLVEPEYHGNPVDPEGGALCFQYFGWEMLDQLRDCGFKKAQAYAYWSPKQGYLGSQQFLFVARK